MHMGGGGAEGTGSERPGGGRGFVHWFMTGRVWGKVRGALYVFWREFVRCSTKLR